jgi:putative colanic acid biosynthesis acetyltransferase WcaF
MNPVRLSNFRNEWYRPGRPRLVQMAWFLFGLPILRMAILPSSAIRRSLLRLFGAKVGSGVVIKPGVRVKYPWLLEVGNDCWLGEDCWIDNLAHVKVGSDVCISQGAYLCTGNHDWSDPSFGLIVRPISLEDGAWIGARAILAPGTSIGECAVVTAGSVVSGRVPDFEIYGGNPAVFMRKRKLKVFQAAVHAVHSEVM